VEAAADANAAGGVSVTRLGTQGSMPSEMEAIAAFDQQDQGLT
jgi:sugar/nucleoside kinase (ribokinase family)